MRKKVPIGVHLFFLFVLIAGLVFSALKILEAPTELEYWGALFGVVIAGTYPFHELTMDFLERRYGSPKHIGYITTNISRSEQNYPDGTRNEESSARINKPNSFHKFAVVALSALAGVGSLAIVTVDYSETLFLWLALPALIGSIFAGLATDDCFFDSRDALWKRLSSAILWGAIGGFAGIIIVAGVLLYLILKSDTRISSDR